jgi:hypothetical protein
MHWCQDETTAVITFFSGLPLAWRWFRAGAARWWKLMRQRRQDKKCTMECGYIFHMTGGQHRTNCPAYKP